MANMGFKHADSVKRVSRSRTAAQLNNEIDANKIAAASAEPKNAVRGAEIKNEPRVAAVKKNDTAEANEATYVCEKNGVAFSFIMPNERADRLDVRKPKVYKQESERLRQAALEVKNQPLFGSVDLMELTSEYYFKPFRYQLENVRIMLNKFEGRGVFGEQVGLGKTVEALITAHAMYKSGAIRNALIIVPANTVDGWSSEIESKFKGVFEFYSAKSQREENDGAVEDERSDRFDAMIKKIHDDNEGKSSTGKLRLYLISEGVFRGKVSEVVSRRDSAKVVSGYYDETTDPTVIRGQEKQFVELETALSGLSEKSGAEFPLREILERFDYGKEGGGKLLALMTNAKHERLKKALDALYARFEGRRFAYSKENKEKVKRIIEEVEEAHEQMLAREEANAQNYSNLLFAKGAKRLVDLVIVDEVHSLYRGDERRDEYSERDSALDLMVQINKKYCILLSATPIRTQLKDIFELVYIADSNRFGSNRKRAEEYFYETVCKVGKDAENKLADMISDESKRSNFFGIINNFFTRKRISDVGDDLNGSLFEAGNGDGGAAADYQPYTSYEEDERNVIDALSELIVKNRADRYKTSGFDDARARAEADFDEWKKNGIKGDSKAKNDRRRHMRASVDAELIKALNSPNRYCLAAEKRTIHGIVDWNRRKKSGIALDIPNDFIEENGFELSGSDNEVYRELSKVAVLPKYLERVFERNEGEGIIYSEKKKNTVADYLYSLSAFPTVCYISRRSFDRESIDGNMRNIIAEHFIGTDYDELGKRSVVLNPTSAEAEIGFGNFNQIAIVNQGYQAGVNLQQYRNLVFAQMDIMGQRLIEPVDVEQWIGRIHRTGQVNNCRVVTLLTTAMIGRNPEKEFLRWYYGILSDSEGLDLYGNSTPDVAFLQPIIVDTLRKQLCAKDSIDPKVNKEAVRRCALVSGTDIQKYSFSQLLEFCYHYDEVRGDNALKENVRDEIVKLCAIDGLGNKKRKER